MKGSIKKDLLKNILYSVFIVGLIGYAIFIESYIYHEKQENIKLSHIVSNVISQDVTKLVYTSDINIASDIKKALKSFDNLYKINIYNKNGEILFQYYKNHQHKLNEKLDKSLIGKTFEKNNNLIIYTKIFYNGVFVAYVKYVFKREPLINIFLDSIPFFSILFFVMLLLAYFLAKHQAEKFTKPILKLVKFLENIKDETFLGKRIQTDEKNEIGLLYEEVNIMLNRIENSIIYDNVTNLYNRYSLLKDIKNQNQTIMLIDIIGFKEINDIYGNEFGDKVLIKFANRLKRCFSNLKIYRIGNDEFVVLCKKQLDEVKKIAITFEKNIKNRNCKIDNIKINISVKIAINNIPPLLENADLALKSLKKDNKHIIIYNEELNIKKEWKKNIETINMVKSAIKEDRIVPYFQGIVNLKTLEIEKYESLVRLILPNGEAISPYLFLDIVSKTSYYYDITKIMIQKVIKTAKNYPNKRFSINFSMKDIINEDIVDILFNLFDEDNEIAKRIDIELLETELVAINDNRIKNFISKVHSYGSKILIDDFGTGYSNFAYLADLDVDFIKIDASITKEILDNPKKLHILKTIHTFTLGLNMKNVAEFVETKEIALLLKELGIDYAQGYLFSKPEAIPLEKHNVTL